MGKMSARLRGDTATEVAQTILSQARYSWTYLIRLTSFNDLSQARY